jgi:hypothetical protein
MNTPTAFPSEDTALSLLVAPLARSNQSPLDGHNTVPTPVFPPGTWDPLLWNPLLFGHPQVWEYPVSSFDERIDGGTFMIQNYGLDVDLTQSPFAQSPLHRPQLDWGSSQERPISYYIQEAIPVSIIVYPQSA